MTGSAGSYVITGSNTATGVGFTASLTLAADETTISTVTVQAGSSGFAVGDNGNIFKTNDCGNNWIDLGTQSIYMMNDVAFINDTLAVAVGAYGSYVFSTNSGESWTYKNINSSETFFAIEKKNSTTASIVGTNGTYAEFSESDLSLSTLSTIDAEENLELDFMHFQWGGHELFANKIYSLINDHEKDGHDL